MSFVEFRFLWFFLVVFIVYWTMRNNTARKVWLLLCSYSFYAAWNWKFTFLVLGSTTVDYIVGQMLYAVCVAWVFFRAHDLGSAGTILKQFVLFRGGGNEHFHRWLLLLAAALALIHWLNSRRWFA